MSGHLSRASAPRRGHGQNGFSRQEEDGRGSKMLAEATKPENEKCHGRASPEDRMPTAGGNQGEHLRKGPYEWTEDQGDWPGSHEGEACDNTGGGQETRTRAGLFVG